MMLFFAPAFSDVLRISLSDGCKNLFYTWFNKVLL